MDTDVGRNDQVSRGDASVGNGKIILLGEHGVVHGRPALAAGLSRGCVASAEQSPIDTLEVEPWGIAIDAEGTEGGGNDTLRKGFRALLAHGGSRPGHYRVRARLEIPAGAGLGASAALSVAVARALDRASGRPDDDGRIFDASLAWEREFHGNPSGVDSSMAVYGGVSLYRRGEPLQPVKVGCPVWLVVGHSGRAPSTGNMVASVARQHGRDPEKVDKIFDAMEAVVHNGRGALAEGNLRDLGQLMDINQKLLNSLMLSTTRLEEMCAAARKAGALGAKLTGGGGGGCMIALSGDAAGAEKVTQALRAFDPNAFAVELGS